MEVKVELTEDLIKQFKKISKEQIDKERKGFKKDADKLIDEAELGMVVMSEKSTAVLGFPFDLSAIILSSLETIIDNDDKYRSMYIEGLKDLLEKVEKEYE